MSQKPLPFAILRWPLRPGLLLAVPLLAGLAAPVYANTAPGAPGPGNFGSTIGPAGMMALASMCQGLGGGAAGAAAGAAGGAAAGAAGAAAGGALAMLCKNMTGVPLTGVVGASGGMFEQALGEVAKNFGQQAVQQLMGKLSGGGGSGGEQAGVAPNMAGQNPNFGNLPVIAQPQPSATPRPAGEDDEDGEIVITTPEGKIAKLGSMEFYETKGSTADSRDKEGEKTTTSASRARDASTSSRRSFTPARGDRATVTVSISRGGQVVGQATMNGQVGGLRLANGSRPTASGMRLGYYAEGGAGQNVSQAPSVSPFQVASLNGGGMTAAVAGAGFGQAPAAAPRPGQPDDAFTLGYTDALEGRGKNPQMAGNAMYEQGFTIGMNIVQNRQTV